MNKKLFLTLSCLMLGFILFFSGTIFSKYFFNDFLYFTPDLTDLTISESQELVSEGSFEIVEAGRNTSLYEKNKIYSQFPKTGTPIKKGRIINVWVSNGFDKVTVPDFRGVDIYQASAAAENMGIQVTNISYVKKDLPHNQVITSEPSPGSDLFKNRKISFLVNSNNQKIEVRMPDIIGLDVFQAKELLSFSNLSIGEVNYAESSELESGIIITSNVQAEEVVPEGTLIDVIINK